MKEAIPPTWPGKLANWAGRTFLIATGYLWASGHWIWALLALLVGGGFLGVGQFFGERRAYAEGVRDGPHGEDDDAG